MIESIDLNNYKLALSQNDCFDIPESILDDWQSILNLLARIEKVKAALIMRITGEDVEVFMSGETRGNPYIVGHKENYNDSAFIVSGLSNKERYCLCRMRRSPLSGRIIPI